MLPKLSDDKGYRPTHFVKTNHDVKLSRVDWDLVQEPVRGDLAKVDQLLIDLFRSPIGIVREVAGHFLATRGKKFRPTLLLLVARLDGRTSRADVTAATVVELIHAAALIHDDSVDKSALRRGLPTVNRLWNDNVAIVIGDYLYSKAFETMVSGQLFDAMTILANVTHRMALGMALELEYEGDLDVSESQYLEIIGAKTASLMAGSCELGSLSGGGRTRPARFRQFGEAVGMSFQITDDVIDFLGDPSETGKRLGTDLREGKVTLPLIRALDQLKGGQRKRVRKLAAARKLRKAEFTELVDLIEEGDGFRYAVARAREYADEAKGYLEKEGPGEILDSLERAVDYAVARTN
jgi:octaprenyl-diphosphate synthase